MRRLILITASLLTAAAVSLVPAASSGSVSPAQLENAGWDCPFVLGAIHCAPPGGLGRVLNGSAKTMSFLVFHEHEFLGTELIVRADVFNGQPCPTDPPTYRYTYLGPHLGLDYYACHRYDSSF
jgi:hypothetical protein